MECIPASPKVTKPLVQQQAWCGRLNSDFAAAYALHPSTQYAVLVKLHGEARLLKQDLLLSLLALALEATEAGFHIYILYQVPCYPLLWLVNMGIRWSGQHCARPVVNAYI